MGTRTVNRIAVIAGAGPAGLTAALELQRRTGVRPLVFEAEKQPGGISRTIVYRGNRMDIGGHRFFSKSDWVMNWWQDILPVASGQSENRADITLNYQNDSRPFAPGRLVEDSEENALLIRPRLSRIYYRRRFFDYPLKLNGRTIRNLGYGETLLIGLSYLKSMLTRIEPEQSLRDFLVNRFGDRLYRTFFKSYTEKVWGVPCEQISAEWGAQRIKGLSVTKAVIHSLRSLLTRPSDISQRRTETSLIERFLYPRLGPGQMWEEVARRVTAGGGEVHYRHRVCDLHHAGGAITAVDVRDLSSGAVRTIPCDYFFSTMPLSELVTQLRCTEPTVAGIARALPYRDFITAGLLVRRMRGGSDTGPKGPATMPPDNWIYIQEPDVALGRIQIFNNWSPHLVQDPNTVWLGLEYFCQEGDSLWSMTDAQFLEFAADELAKIGLIERSDVLDGTVVRVPKAYPAYFGEYERIGRVRDWLDGFANLFPIGRNGMHRYNNQDHSMLAARAAVDCVVAGSVDKSGLWAVNAEEDYHEERTASP
jgi:protoporphyrinogen oxidase